MCFSYSSFCFISQFSPNCSSLNWEVLQLQTICRPTGSSLLLWRHLVSHVTTERDPAKNKVASVGGKQLWWRIAYFLFNIFLCLPCFEGFRTPWMVVKKSGYPITNMAFVWGKSSIWDPIRSQLRWTDRKERFVYSCMKPCCFAQFIKKVFFLFKIVKLNRTLAIFL